MAQPADERGGEPAGEQAEQDDFAARTGYRPSTNQAREEPVPASHHEDRDQEAVLRNEELGDGRDPGDQGGDVPGSGRSASG
jgi:hypothetical protein